MFLRVNRFSGTGTSHLTRASSGRGPRRSPAVRYDIAWAAPLKRRPVRWRNFARSQPSHSHDPYRNGPARASGPFPMWNCVRAN